MTAGWLLPPWALVALLVCWLGLLALSRWSRWRVRWPRATTDLAAAGLLGLLWLGFHWRPLLTREASVPAGGGDFNSFYYPLARFAADQIQAGRLPLWNPTLRAGAPLAADFQVGLLYPPNLLAFWLARPFEYGALELLAIGHYWLASLTAYALWRGLGGGPGGGLTAGLIYAYGGFLVAHLGHPPMLAVAAWLPLLLLSLTWLLKGSVPQAAAREAGRWSIGAVLAATLGRSGRITATAGMLALLILAGHPQLVLMGLVVAGLWCLVVLGVQRATLRPAGWLSAGLSLALAGGLGVALAAPVLLPALQLGRYSVRAALAYSESIAFSLRPLHLLHLFVPKAFGDSPTSYLNAIDFNGEVWSYAGVITLLLASAGGLGLTARGRWTGSTWPVLTGLGLIGLALLLELGPATPLHGWLYRFVPGFGQVRAPGRWSLVYSLGLALAAAGGVDLLLANLRQPAAALAVTLARVARGIALAAGALLLLIALLVGQLLAPREPSAPLANLIDGLAWLWLLLVLAAVTTHALRWAGQRPALAGGLLVGLVVLDLFAAHLNFNPTTDDLLAGFRHPEIIGRLQATPGSVRLDSDSGTPELWQPSTAAIHGLQDVGGTFNPLGLAHYATVYELAHRDRSTPLYNLLAVTHIVARPDKLGRAGPTTSLVTAPSRLVLYERGERPARALVVYRARVLPTSEAVLAALRQPGWSPTTEVLLSDGSPLGDGGAVPASEPATVLREEPNGLEIAVRAEQPAYLVLADTDYPGWRAEVDGRPAPVLRANYAFRAVPLPAGSQQVRLIFDPPLWRWGWLAALAALVLLAALNGLGWLVHRRSTAAQSPPAS